MSLKMSFKVGDKIVYPNHGVTIVEQIGGSSIAGADSTYYHLRLLANNSRLMVPISNIDRVGLRKLYQQKEIKGLLSLLEEHQSSAHSDWKGRYRDNLEKMKTGRLEDVADVLKNLNEVQKKKSLSFREKKMYDRAKYLLVSEIAIVKGIPEPEAEGLVERSLGNDPMLATDHSDH
ncbi:MAG TPA: CarD family transcriptional regulator [Thermoanaerobaculia bacterium]|nr:CarD family transcriptional regulator [Thermoanaerobaculia bacterium]